MTRTLHHSFAALALALVALTACGSDELPAYANVTVSFDDTITVDQLRFEVLRDNNLVGEPAMRPESPGGPLQTAITVTIILPAAVEGRDISVRVTGYYQGEVVTSGRVYNIVPLPGRGVDVNITLGHVLQTFTVEPTSVSFPVGATQQIVASATFSDENDGEVSEQATWTSSDTNVVTVSMEPGSRGLARAIAVGSATITVVLQGQTLQVPVTVTARRLESLTLAPSLLSLALGNTAALQATAVYSDGQAVDVSADPGTQWQSNNPGVVSVDASGNLATLNQGNAEITARFGGRMATAPVVVTIPQIESVVIEPADARIAKGFTRQFFAYGIRSDGSRVNITSAVSFSISPQERASITSLGLVTGVAEGDVTITALSAEGPIGTVDATVTDATLVRFSISPTTPTVPQGQPVTFTATGTYSDGTDSDITSLVTWQSSNPAVATVPASGSSTYTTAGLSTGQTTVRATIAPLATVTTVLTVSEAVLDHITVAPSSSSIAKGQTATFTATGILTDGNTTDLTSVALWSSTNTTVATMSGNVATAATVGTTNIRATFGGKTGQAVLNVTAAQLLSIAITPTSPSVIVATTQAMVATGTFTDGTRAITDQVTWSITNQVPVNAGDTVATIGTTTGVVTGSRAGTANIRAQLSGVTGNQALTVVNATLTAIDVLPASPAVIVGNTVQLTARGTFNNGTQQDITGTVQWSSAPTTVATVNNGANKGLVTGVGAGTATVSASSGTCPGASCITGTRDVAVSAAVVTSVTIDETSPLTLASGATGQLHATAHYNNGENVDVTQAAVWVSTDTNAATVDNGNPFGGRVNAKSGLTSSATTNITAAFGTKTSSSFVVNVSAAVLTSIAITPATLNLAAGESGNLTATGTYNDSTTRNITADVTWAITTQTPNTVGQTVATISNAAGEKGKVTSVSQGTAAANATLGAVTSSPTATINVTQAISTSIDVSCPATSLANGEQTQCTATATLTNGQTLDYTNSPNGLWSITPGSVATGTVVAGLLTGSSQGTLRARCTGRLSGVSGDSQVITIGPAVVRSISVDPGSVTVTVGDPAQVFTATATYTDNSTVPNATVDSWMSSDTSVATCDSSGTCTILAEGTTTITATIGTKSGTATLIVNP